ncbi:MAG: septum formation protein Maf [Firmicutes bacterium ZCTH02-B6]|nr:MAG: septum formation protein Maf [Firmicutes bacterium ZCTH02-B6]
MDKPIILASASPRRQQLLAETGLPFTVAVSEVDEEAIIAGSPRELAEQRALHKARAVAVTLPDGLVIGADTIVLCQGQVLGKPKDAADAKRLLSLLSGRSHRVVTGVCVLEAPNGRCLVASACTKVTFRQLSPEEIDRYVATGEPMDKAGAYGIQGKGALVVERLVGGEELGFVIDDVMGLTGGKGRLGAVGLLTGGLVTREALWEHAVACALIPHRHPALYPAETAGLLPRS